ncbi:hypothetical protein Vqi01_09870 [Micromonospora qiuiae]|uniref:AraC family transcriptional regulator n=1 Tax=Micromonospora qiuiae TaxID=502268 RepID=A0ABQ4J6R5_9ACTN|nr:hypothetical protein [Micromonospora qiuiae]GIJ25825.1 hypothetical protein Vqi01_09870 [Micromonospora qiuiae]
MRGPPDDFQALLARNKTYFRPVGPAAFDCVQVVFIRDGSAILLGEAGQEPVSIGDVLLLGPNVLYGAEPEGHVTVTTIYLDLDYLLDQVFWQHSHILRDRLDAQGFAETIYAEAAQVLRIGEQRVSLLLPALDELVAVSIDGGLHRFHRMQSLWFAIVDQIAPSIRVTRTRQSASQRARIHPTHLRARQFTPMRPEARTALDLLLRHRRAVDSRHAGRRGAFVIEATRPGVLGDVHRPHSRPVPHVVSVVDQADARSRRTCVKSALTLSTQS